MRPNNAAPYDYPIVGTGFAGSVLAKGLAASGKRVFRCDRRPHIAGNTSTFATRPAYSSTNTGRCIFHSEEIFAYLSRFTRWRPYDHRVLYGEEGDQADLKSWAATTLPHLQHHLEMAQGLNK